MGTIIIKNAEEITVQLPLFKKAYPDMELICETVNEIKMRGKFSMHREFDDFQVLKTYSAEIVIPIATSELPYVVDVGKHISPKYHHYYPNGRLCLEADVKIIIDYIDGFDLLHWMNKYVESYYFTYEYYMYFGEFPYGERSHNYRGKLEAYHDIIKGKDVVETFEIMQYMNQNSYRGHNLCPCKSGRKLRDCHGPQIISFYTDARLHRLFKKDYEEIKEGIYK